MPQFQRSFAVPYRSQVLRIFIFLVILGILIQTALAVSIHMVDANGGDKSAVTLNGSHPVISYYDRNTQALKVAFCGDEACAALTTNSTKTIDATSKFYTSAVTVINGNPVIAYGDFANADLKVAACSDALCSGSITITTVDTNLNLFGHISMAVLAGNPVISYLGGSQDLMLAACNDPGCTSATITPVDTLGDVGVSSAIMVLNGNPIIAYDDFVNADLKVAACNNPTCTSATITVVDTTGSVGSWISMTAINSNPIISYGSASPTGLKVAACTDPACTSATITTLDAVSPTGTSIDIINGLPVIAYGGSTSLGHPPLKLATCNDASCTSATLTPLTGSGDSGQFPAMANLNNYPAISYFDPKNNQLRFYFAGEVAPAPILGPLAIAIVVIAILVVLLAIWYRRKPNTVRRQRKSHT